MPPGVAPDAGGPDGGGEVNDPLAVASLALGAASLVTAFCCWPLMFAVAVGGIATAIVALVRIHAEPLKYRGRGAAITGLVLSLLAPLGYVLLIVFYGALSIFGFPP